MYILVASSAWSEEEKYRYSKYSCISYISGDALLSDFLVVTCE